MAPQPRGRFTLGGTEVIGGPFEACPAGVFSVCLEERASNAWLADILLPTPDFGTPEPEALRQAVRNTLAAMAEAPERPVFIGCLAGLGRTGLFMACLAKASGIEEDPVLFIRRVYHPHAVETPAQQALVRGFSLD